MNVHQLKSKIRSHWLLALILLVGFMVRWQHIKQPLTDTFSWRQSSTAMMAQNFYQQNPNIFYPEVNWTGPRPGYQGREFQTISYLASIGYRIFGQHDYIGRIIAIAFGMWGLFALYQLVLITWDRKHALAATSMMAIIPGSAFIDRSFLPDPVMVSLTTTCMWLFVLFLQSKQHKYLWWATLTGTLGVLTKLPGLIIALPLAFAWLIYYKEQHLNIKKYRYQIGIAILLGMTIITGYYAWARYLSTHYPPYHFAGSGNWIWDNWKIFFKEKYFLQKLKDEMEYWILGYPAIILFLLGIILPPPSPEQQPRCLKWFFHLLLAGCMFYYLIGAKELVSNPWNFHLFLPVISVFCGRVIVVLLSFNFGFTGARILQVLVLYGCILIFNIDMMRSNLFTDARAADAYHMGKRLQQLKQKDELVVTLTHDIGDPVGIYYSGGKGWGFPDYEFWTYPSIPPDSVAIKNLEHVHKNGAAWFGIVQKHYEQILTDHPQLLTYLQTKMKTIEQTKDYIIFKW